MDGFDKIDGGPIKGLAILPDLTKCNYFMWGFVKNKEQLMNFMTSQPLCWKGQMKSLKNVFDYV